MDGWVTVVRTCFDWFIKNHLGLGLTYGSMSLLQATLDVKAV